MAKDKSQSVTKVQVATKARKFKTIHNGTFFIASTEFKEDEVKELSIEQLEIKNVKHAIEIGMLIEVD